jgi:hypothetical protein
VHLHSIKLFIFLYILIFLECSLPAQQIKELEFTSSIEALNYERDLLDILRDLNLLEKMLMDLKSDTESSFHQLKQNKYPIDSNVTSKLTTIQEKLNCLFAMVKHSFTHVDMQRQKHLLYLQELEKINEIRKQKQFQIIKQQEEKRRLERIEKRNEKKRLEISKKLQTQKYSDEQETLKLKEQKLLEAIARIDEKKHLQQMRKIQNIHSLDGIRSMIEEIKAEIVQLKSL